MLRFPPARPHRALLRPALAAALWLLAAYGAEVHVDVPENCGSQAEFERELERLLGADAGRLSAYTLTIARSEPGADYLLRLSLRHEVRELRDADCRTLFKTAVVVAAASVKPGLLSDGSGQAEALPPAEPARIDEPRAAGHAEAPDPTSAHAPRARPWRGTVGAGAGGIAGLVPDIAPVFELSGLLERKPWGAALSARYTALSAAEVEGGRGVEVRAWGARAGALYHPAAFVRLSAGLEADLMIGRGTGVTTPLSDEAWSLAAALELAAIPLHFDDLHLELALQGRWALVRPSFQIEGFGEAYRVPTLGAAALIRATYSLF